MFFATSTPALARHVVRRARGWSVVAVLAAILTARQSLASEGVYFRAAAGGFQSGANTYNQSLTVTTTAPTTNRYLLIGVQVADASTTISSVTWNSGAAIPQVGSDILVNANGEACRAAFYGLVNPGTGTHNVTVNLSGTQGVVFGGIAFTGVNQTTPTGGFTSSISTSSPVSLPVTTIEGDEIVDLSCVDSQGSTNTGALTNGTSLWDANDQNNTGSNVFRIKAANNTTTTTLSHDFGGTSFTVGYGAVAVKKANGAAVHIESVGAFSSGRRVRLNWRTGFELDNLGFNVYREDGLGRRLLTPSPIAGSALLTGPGVPLTAGRLHSFDEILPAGQTPGRYWLEEIDLNGTRTWHGPVRATSAPLALPPVRDNEALVSLALAASEDFSPGPAYRVAPVVPVGGADASQWALAGQASIKIGVDRPGWYEVEQPALVTAGLDPSVDPRTLTLFVEGQPVPMRVRGESDGRLDPGDALGFYSAGLNAASSGTAVLWLSSGGPAARLPEIPAGAADVAAWPRTFRDLAERRPRNSYFAALRNGDGNNFFGPYITKTAVTDSIGYRDLVPDATHPVLLEVGIQGVSLKPHEIAVEVDGIAAGTIQVYGRTPGSLRMPLPQLAAGSGAVAVKLTALGADSDVSVLDYLRLEYPRALMADNGRLRWSAPGGSTTAVGGLASHETVVVLDVTEPSSPVGIDAEVDVDGKLVFQVPGAGLRSLMVDSHVATPTLSANVPSHWSAPQPGGDLVVIGPRALLPGIEPLARLRESQGWTVVRIDAEDVYDELGYGVPSAGAIRSLLARARAVWTRKPRAVILLGDASFDPRGFLGQGRWDLLPTGLVDTSTLETASDDWLTDLDDDGIADVPTGRLPARTPSDLDAMVKKLVAAPSFATVQEAAAAGPLLFLNGPPDDGPGGNLFAGNSVTPRRGPWNSVSIDPTQAGAPTPDRFRAALHDRPLLVSYLGHGSQELWPGGLLSTDSVATLDNPGPGAFWASYSCLNGFFHDVYKASLAEALLTQPRSGAFGVWASSTLADLGPQVSLGQAFTDSLLHDGLTVGEAAQRAKLATTDVDVRRTWILFGDPTWRLVAAPLPEAAPDGGLAVDGGEVAPADAGHAADASAGNDGGAAQTAGSGCGCVIGNQAPIGPSPIAPIALIALAFLQRARRRR
jgi:hypothetical protein